MKRMLLGVLLALTILCGSGLASTPAFAASSTDAARDQVCRGVSGTGSGCNSGGRDLTRVVKAVINILSVIAGVAAVIMIIISGMRYITSGGDAQDVSGAKRSLIYALVGLVVVAVAQFLVHFVLNNTEK